MKKVSIIIPVFNEEKALKSAIEAVRSADSAPFEKEIIIVDDGSTDRTPELLKQYSGAPGIKILTLETNHGKGFAIRAALGVSSGETVMLQDADLEYSPTDYKAILAPFKDNSTAAVYGSRFLKKAWPDGMKPHNYLANKLFTSMINLLYGAGADRITDEGTAYKAFRIEVLRSIKLRELRFEFCAEVTAKLLKRGLKIVEVPVSYRARTRREGKKPRVSDGFSVLRAILKYRFMD